LITRTSLTLLEGLKDPAGSAAWQEFVARYRPLVVAVARRLGLQEADAQDVAQEVLVAFVQAYRQQRYDRDKGALRSWLRGIAWNKVHDVLRRRGREPVPVADRTDATGLLDQVPDPRAESVWAEEWGRAVLRQCLEEVRLEVSPQTYEAFVLLALREWPARRVAGHLQVSEDVVYQSKSRILKRVRELLPQIEKNW
jgi:RNA polymerase sigma-70 factor (ECF subfamily)